MDWYIGVAPGAQRRGGELHVNARTGTDRPRRGRHRRRGADVRRIFRPLARRARARTRLPRDVQPHPPAGGRRRSNDASTGARFPRRSGVFDRNGSRHGPALRSRLGGSVRPVPGTAGCCRQGGLAGQGHLRLRQGDVANVTMVARDALRAKEFYEAVLQVPFSSGHPGTWRTGETTPPLGIWLSEGAEPEVQLSYRVGQHRGRGRAGPDSRRPRGRARAQTVRAARRVRR